MKRILTVAVVSLLLTLALGASLASAFGTVRPMCGPVSGDPLDCPY